MCDYAHVPPALVFYEHSITFAREVKTIWFRKPSLPSTLFLLNRYILLLNASITVAIPRMPTVRCMDVIVGVDSSSVLEAGGPMHQAVLILIWVYHSVIPLQRANEVLVVLTYVITAGTSVHAPPLIVVL